MQIQAIAAHEQGAMLRPYTFETESLGSFGCVIKVLACGICHSDLHVIDNDWGTNRYPMVPGHEVIGEVTELGPEVRHLKIGDRVGVGWQASSCMECRYCLRGDENLCDENKGLITDSYGGFADYLQVDARFAFRIPDGIKTEHAGPLLCGGITVYSGLRNAGMTSGQNIGIIGVGGLGHMAVQFASKLGNRVTVYTTSPDKAEFAAKLGAHEALVVPREGALPQPQRPLDIILNTAPASLNWPDYLAHLDADGTLAFVGVPAEPLNIPIWALLGKRRRIMASPIGGRPSINEMLDVSDRYGIEPIVETFSFDQVNEALQKVRDNTVRYRAVLVR
ncbi:NAD(P)-dependent alcohol dehydrogenase [Geitlerinema sp. PCC 7407]|uniref:NAD(P)-dependent alcohol dehydrogenase n=1 Tax=Geitlerinema sp. PCC 7407 TaxID=1173025 RepID=UPI0002A00081|nr:NAD(P)-dependent alcohol dehydrogenase [Geitlerinema sp. PCC 7407]AFY67536.1 Alcohol dehydrogenase GroES domain protein [Geitlerinema sp. PCC 7407]